MNAKIRHVYTQEVTTVEGRDQLETQANHQSQTVTCHRQTQTEPQSFPESKQRQEVEQIIDEDNENGKMCEEKSDKSGQNVSPSLEIKRETETKKVDASTSPIPSPYFPISTPDTMSPFTGCSQMSVYPPLNYVRKLEDLEKITGHIVIQRFFTRTDDAFGSWLEKQLGMTSKSVSVDTSEFESENAKEGELHKVNDDDDGANASATNNEIVIDSEKQEEIQEVCNEGTISGAVSNPGEGGFLETENQRQSEEDSQKLSNNADCTLDDPVKCECYLKEIEGEKGDH